MCGVAGSDGSSEAGSNGSSEEAGSSEDNLPAASGNEDDPESSFESYGGEGLTQEIFF